MEHLHTLVLLHITFYNLHSYAKKEHYHPHILGEKNEPQKNLRAHS